MLYFSEGKVSCCYPALHLIWLIVFKVFDHVGSFKARLNNDSIIMSISPSLSLSLSVHSSLSIEIEVTII